MTNISHDSEVLAKGQQVITATAFIHQVIDGEESVFLAKRADTKKFMPGVYELPGGHIDFGEGPVDGLIREIMEEFNAEIEVGDPFFVFTYVNEIKMSHSIEIIYFARFADGYENIQTNPEDHSGYKWFSESQMDQVGTANKSVDDIEFQGVRKGFSILKGEQLNT